MVTSQWGTHGTLKYKLYVQVFVKLRTISLSPARSKPISQEDALTEKQIKQRVAIYVLGTTKGNVT